MVVGVRTMMGMIWNDGHDGLWLFGAFSFLGWGGGCLPYPALLPAPVTLTLALSRCCWVFWGRGDSPSSLPVHPWVPAPVSGYGASFGGMTCGVLPIYKDGLGSFLWVGVCGCGKTASKRVDVH